MSKNVFYCARFYVTYRCNSKCVYCNVWRNKKFQNVPEMSLEQAKILIKQCYEQGVRYIDFTGGEPTLCSNLPDMIRYAKSLGIKTEVTSNCISDLSKSKMMIVASEVDKFNISLDTLNDGVYHRVRGVNSCSAVKKALQEIALIRSPKIMMVITDDNVAEINDMIEYAAKNKAQIYLSPMFPYIDKDGNYCVSQHISKIIKCIFRPYTIVLLHFMLFFKEASLQHLSPCSANLHTLTFSPAGNLVLPCYHAAEDEILWNGDLKSMINSDKFQSYADFSGIRDGCKGCCAIPYFGISFNYQLNKYFLLQSFSEKLAHMKKDGLNSFLEKTNIESDKLNGELAELMDIAQNLAYEPDIKAYRNRDSFLYPYQKDEDGIKTPVYIQNLPEDLFKTEQKAQDCWQLRCVPHYCFDIFFKDVILPFLIGKKEVKNEKEFTENLLLFQIYWWKFYIVKYFKLKKHYDNEKNVAWLKEYLAEMRTICSAKIINEMIEML